MAGRVFTVANESRYVVVRNVPALGVIEDLLKRLSLYGKVCEYRLLDHADDRRRRCSSRYVHDDSEFTDTVWVQYETVNNARHAKARGVQKPFYGHKLQISYAPQFESREDTADKLAQRRQLLQRRARPNVYHAERKG
ncbi:Nucleotide-binding alpha-beta plait domain [Phytophthora cactorum]|nr:Nucleotide-binding alpha-beta plait domain [Phytophthora cactorum]